VAAPLFTWQIALPFFSEPYAFRFTLAQPLAVAVVLAVTGVNYLGIRLGGRVQVALTAAKIVALLAVVALGLVLEPAARGPSLTTGTGVIQTAGLGGFLAALVAALWAYDGWTAATLVGAEIENPQKNISRALVGSVLFVGVVYVLANVAYFSALSLPGVAQSEHVASDVVQQFAGPGTAKWITLAMLLSALGALNSTVLSGARVPYAMARDGRFFRFAARIHPTHRTPASSLFFQAGLGSAFALTGTFEELFSLVIFAAWMLYGLTVAALFMLRRREPNLHRPYRAWGYPFAPAIFVLGSLALTVHLWLEHPVRSSIGLALILCGLVFFRHWSRHNSALDH
jgi:APA family basic amino acid/polyamine antiporter